MNISLYRSLRFICVAVGLASPTAHATDRLFLCGGPQIREIEAGTSERDPRYKVLWQWMPERSIAIPNSFLPKLDTIDDCKPSPDGKEIFVSSSSGAIAIVSYPTGDALFYASVPNAHSISALPNGFVVAAASVNKDGNRLMLFERTHSDSPVFSLPLNGAHGVTWDPKRNVLWALGDEELLRLSLQSESRTLTVEKRYPLEHGGGHDLVLSQDGQMLFVTTVSEALTFDIAGEEFSVYQPLAGRRNVKSVTFHPTTGRLAFTQADPRVWWTYTIRLLSPGLELPLESETYKVRWSSAR